MKRRLIGVALLVATLAGAVAFSVLHRPNETGEAKPKATTPFAGAIDVPSDEAIVSTSVIVSGWALAVAGVKNVALRLHDGGTIAAKYGLPRLDVAGSVSGYPNSSSAGFEIRHEFPDLRPIRHPMTIFATNNLGAEHVVGRRGLIPPEAFRIWSSVPSPAGESASPAFHFLMAASNVSLGWARDITATYKGYVSVTQRVGLAVPILYLRTTKGRTNDWVFDADFDITRKCGDRLLAEDSLNLVLRSAIESRLPIQLIMNGGVWSDASCSDPGWDLTDHLEEVDENCQWTQDNTVFADDHLKNLAGATASPELARSLTLNVYAAKVRDYKRRNLQAAARRVAEFARSHPELFVGVNLDSDTSVNPFFEEREWFDYNPGTIRQFREWLRGDGPYAGRSGSGVPDLRHWRRKNPLTLAEVNKIARRNWKSWSEVDPPRRFPGSRRDALRPGETPIWDDPWYREWDTFRKHLVALHYAELARWTHEAGIPRERIFTAIGFVAPEGDSRPFAVRVTSSGQNYDSGGISIEGGIPSTGHLGAILYGPSAENRVRMEHRHGLFATFARMDPAWAVVEMNTADLRRPEVLPTYAQAYRAFRDLFNYDAKQASLMAWNGSNGIYAGQPGYVSYMAWRNTPAEEAMRDQMVSHANLPRGSRLWTFGSAQHADDDGWSVEGATLKAGRGRITLQPNDPRRSIELLSPGDQVIWQATAGRLVLGGTFGALRGNVELWAEREPGTGWHRLGAAATSGAKVVPAGLLVDLSWPSDWPSSAIAERLKIVVSSDALPPELVIDRVALIRGSQ